MNSDEVVYDQPTVDSYVETEEWRDFLIGHPCDSAVFVKGTAVRRIVPTRV